MSNLIVDIQGIDFEKSNITFVNGLTMERVRIKYNWLLNAKVKDVIVGEDDYGLVWYFGEWFCGEWIDGTWYSGNFHSGNWNNGKWFSYKLNKFDVVNEKFIIEETGTEFSKFINGVWLNGVWDNGTFGTDNVEDWNEYELFYYKNKDYLEIDVPNFKKDDVEKKVSTWLNGVWNGGLFQNAIWDNGIFNDGEMKNSMWINGRFYYGFFNGDTWMNGEWMNGEFLKGKWLNGVFTKLRSDIISRFGSNRTEVLETVCEWYNGEWKNGDWFSGIQEINNNYYSYNNKMSIWYDGVWRNGVWNGGHFKNGNWYNGVWEDGIYGDILETDWVKPKNVYEYVDDELTENIVYHPAFTGLTNLGTFWSGSTQGTILTASTNNTGNSYYEQEYLEISYQTQLGGWDDAVPPNSGVEIDNTTSAITLYIRDGYTLDDYNSFSQDRGQINDNGEYVPMKNSKKRDFTYELSNTNILDIGGTGFTVSSVTFHNPSPSEEVEWKFGHHPNKSIKSKGYTILKINEYWDGLYDDLVNLVDRTVNIHCKEKVIYDKGDFDDRTYLKIDKIINYKSHMTYVCSGPISDVFYEEEFPIIEGISIYGEKIVKFDREVFIDIDTNDSRLTYLNGNNLITDVYPGEDDDIGKFYLVSKRVLNTSLIEVEGKMVNLFEYRKRQEKSKPKNIMFDDLTDIQIDSSKILKGIKIKINKEKIENGIGEIYDNEIILPFKNLKFNYYDGILHYNTFDKPDYSPYNYGDYYVDGKKEVSTLIKDGKNYYGSMKDLWGLIPLKYYYDDVNFNMIDYDITNINSLKNNLRLLINFSIKDSITTTYRISDIAIKLYYVDDDNYPNFHDGFFKKGLWLNGVFIDGKMVSSLVIEGTFKKGIIGYEENEKRKI